jgi:tetratricopeptide (TPR) repeat protein
VDGIEMAASMKRTGLSIVAGLLLAVWADAPAMATGYDEPSSAVTPYGAYLAGRHAQGIRDYKAAAAWYQDALKADPKSPELISRTFQMEAVEGDFSRARALAADELKIDPTDAVAQLTLLIDRLDAGDAAAALARAEALPPDGVHRYLGPLARAWMRLATGDLNGAVTALDGLDRFNGLAPLKLFQLALVYDVAGKADLAEENYAKALEATGQLNWRLADAMANFYARHGRMDKAEATYQRFRDENSGSELAEAMAGAAPDPTRAVVGTPKQGLAEALFDLASIVNRPETIDLALLYDRYALELRPDLTVARLLLADVLTAQDKAEASLAVLGQIPEGSPYSWSARLRAAANLEMLDRTDEAIAEMQAMAAQDPHRAGAVMQLGDLLRSKKRFLEAADAYDEAIKRLKAAGLPERWSLYYSRGIALERAGEWKRAEADLEHALELKPDQPLVLNYLGYSWIDRGENLQRGLKMIEKAVELRPEDGYIVDSLGWAHYRLGDYGAAVQYLEKALELVPEDPTINDHLGDAYWQAGRPVEARYQWRRALQFGPEKNEIKPIEAKLDGAPPTSRAGGG